MIGRRVLHSVSAVNQRIFVTKLNIEHYRRKLLTERREEVRQRIAQLLAEEEAKLTALDPPPERKRRST